jgi:diacylglycerol kinase family enzyme
VRALLVFNPHATTTDDRVRDVIAAALSSAVDLEVTPTKQRGHATLLAAGAVHEGMDAVFALGGDGTANEVLQALAGTPVAMGVIPGGGANVLARALGLPNDPIAATSIALEHLRAGRRRSISLGLADDRWFGFNAGFGFDAAVVRRVEQNAALKRRLRQGAFVWLAVQAWFGDEHVHNPSIDVELADGSHHGPYGVTMIGNADPYTYLGQRPMRVTPQASFDTALDLMALERVGTARLLATVGRVFSGGRHVGHAAVAHWHDLDSFRLSAPTPMPLMVDGDYAGEHRAVTFRAVRDAMQVLA